MFISGNVYLDSVEANDKNSDAGDPTFSKINIFDKILPKSSKST